MPDLFCSVSDCRHNLKGCCCLDSIDVSGGESRTNTCCESFSKQKRSGSDEEYSANEYTGIGCMAKDCVHNKNCKCTASSVNICNCGCTDACRCDDTECETFKCR